MRLRVEVPFGMEAASNGNSSILTLKKGNGPIILRSISFILSLPIFIFFPYFIYIISLIFIYIFPLFVLFPIFTCIISLK